MIHPGPALRAVLAALPEGTVVARSCKLTAGALSAERFLCSLDRARLAPAAGKRFLALAAAFLGQSAAPLAPHLGRARAFHLALDPSDAGGELRKAYVELDPGDDDLAYVALKASSRGARLTQYLHRDPGQALEVLRRLDLPRPLAAAAEALCRDLGANPDLAFLEVREEGTPRLSLDLNLADLPPDAGVRDRITDLARLLNPTPCWPASGLSHLAIGQGASGAPFLTLYGFPEPVARPG